MRYSPVLYCAVLYVWAEDFFFSFFPFPRIFLGASFLRGRVARRERARAGWLAGGRECCGRSREEKKKKLHPSPAPSAHSRPPVPCFPLRSRRQTQTPSQGSPVGQLKLSLVRSARQVRPHRNSVGPQPLASRLVIHSHKVDRHLLPAQSMR